MKILSFLNTALEDFKATLFRFPMPLSMAYLAGLSFMIAVENNTEIFTKIGVVFLLGFLLTFAVDTFAEVNKKNIGFKILAYLLAVIVMALIYFFELDFDSNIMGFRLMFIFGVGFLLSLIAPFIKKNQSANGFWQYNVMILTSIFMAIIYFGLLDAGISALLASFEFLFNFGLHEELFLHTFILLSCIGATSYVLYRIPENIESLSKITEYPTALRTITSRILVPIIGVYAILVYAFVLKLIANGIGPDYQVSFQIMAFSSVGVLAYLFAWLLRDEGGYLKHFHKYFFAYLMPLIIVLFVAIIEATFTSGLTQTRYFVLAFGLIMMIWSIYYLFGKSKDIRMVHLVAATVCLFALFAPILGARPLALYSQTQVIHNGLIESGAVVDGVYTDYDGEFKVKTGVESRIGDAARYVSRSYSNEEVDVIFDEFDGDSKDAWQKFFAESYYRSNDRYFDHYNEVQEVDVEGFLKGYRFFGGGIDGKVKIRDNKLLIEGGYSLDLAEFVSTIEKYNDELTYIDPAGNFVVYFESINGRNDNEVSSASGFVFVK
jgi:hypothetical protein